MSGFKGSELQGLQVGARHRLRRRERHVRRVRPGEPLHVRNLRRRSLSGWCAGKSSRTPNPSELKYAFAPGQNFFVKHGAYVEAETPLALGVDAIGRVDGLWRIGDVAAASPLTNETFVMRYTIGASIVLAQRRGCA
jgi:hypothetical protein